MSVEGNGLKWWPVVRQRCKGETAAFPLGLKSLSPSNQSYDPHKACCLLSKGPQSAHVGVCNRDGKSLA